MRPFAAVSRSPMSPGRMSGDFTTFLAHGVCASCSRLNFRDWSSIAGTIIILMVTTFLSTSHYRADKMAPWNCDVEFVLSKQWVFVAVLFTLTFSQLAMGWNGAVRWGETGPYDGVKQGRTIGGIFGLVSRQDWEAVSCTSQLLLDLSLTN